MSWKDDIRKKRQAEQAQQQALAAQQRQERERKEAAAKAAREQAEYNRKLSILQRSFKCHICRTPATVPDSGMTSPTYKSDEFWTPSPYTNWNRPGDLYQCTECHNWACNVHSVELAPGINRCQRCAEKELRRRR